MRRYLVDITIEVQSDSRLGAWKKAYAFANDGLPGTGIGLERVGEAKPIDLPWTVTLEDIVWDREVDGEEDEDTVLPRVLTFDLYASDEDDAINQALERASNITGFAIIDCNALHDAGGY